MVIQGVDMDTQRLCPVFQIPHTGCGCVPSDAWEATAHRTTVRVEKELEAMRLLRNGQCNSCLTKGAANSQHLTEQTLDFGQSSLLPPAGLAFTFGNLAYVVLFGWWMYLAYLVVAGLMFLTLIGASYGKLCWRLSGYFLWPFGKVIHQNNSSDGDDYLELDEYKSDCSQKLPPSSSVLPQCQRHTGYWLWLLLGFLPLCVLHALVCLFSWLLVFSIPVAHTYGRAVYAVLLQDPEQLCVAPLHKAQNEERNRPVLLCCNFAFSWHYCKYTVGGINVFAVNMLPLVVATLAIGYMDRSNHITSSQVKFATALSSIIPLSCYIGMGIASISAQSNFAVGAVVNATFGSIAELTFYITALLRGRQSGTRCYEEVVKAALTGSVLGCILFIPGICMIIGGCRHREQIFNSRSAAVSSALLFISVGGVLAPTLFLKVYGNLICENCNPPADNRSALRCQSCHYDLTENNYSLFYTCVQPLVYTIAILLPAAYLLGLFFTLRTHSHIYNIHSSEAAVHGSAIHWSRWKALLVLLVATVMMSACADLASEHIKPILLHSSISQYFISVTVLAMAPELPEVLNGILFALQNNISLSLEVGNCIAVQVCMIQIPLLILFSAIFDLGFVLLFSDLHLWASVFSVFVINFTFMGGKSDYFQGITLVVVYFILLTLYYFAPPLAEC